MGLIAKDLPALVFMLLPGFIAAGIFYALTSHPKSSEFERIIQSLIFTSLIKLETLMIRPLAVWIGRFRSFGTWDSEVELGWSMALALPTGLVFVWIANSDRFHRCARRLGLSSRMSYPSEWYTAFLQYKRWVILHLQDGRRLFGWPEQWPDSSDRGHFVIDQPEWLLDDNQRAPLHQVQTLMIPATDVRMVEFLKQNDEILAEEDELERVARLLTGLQEGGDGRKAAAARTEPPDESGRMEGNRAMDEGG